jgi:hypothetical protein
MFDAPVSPRASGRASRRQRMLVTGNILLLSVLSLTGAAAAAQAAPPQPLDRFSIAVGGFYVEPEIEVNSDTRYGRIESGREKGSRTTLPKAKLDVLFGERHGLAVDYIRYDKKYNPRLTGDTVIDGEVITGNASLDAKLRLDLARVAYKYWFGEGNSVFGVGLGAAYYRAKLSGTASATVEGIVNGVPESRTVSGSDSDSDSAYAPVVELGWRHAVSPEVRLFADASGVKKNKGKINGHIYSAALGVEWMAMKNVGVVLDYGIQKIDLHRDSDRDSDLLIKLAGPSAYVKVAF